MRPYFATSLVVLACCQAFVVVSGHDNKWQGQTKLGGHQQGQQWGQDSAEYGQGQARSWSQEQQYGQNKNKYDDDDDGYGMSQNNKHGGMSQNNMYGMDMSMKDRKMMQKMAMMAMNPLEMIKKLMNVEYFTVESDSGEEDDDVCMDVPRRTMMGSPFDESCKKYDEEDEICVCAKMPEDMKDYDKNWKQMQQQNNWDNKNNKKNKKGGMRMKTNKNGYMLICGKCVDPCSLKFKPSVDDAMMMPPPPPPPPFGLLPPPPPGYGPPPPGFGNGGRQQPEEVPKFVQSLVDTALKILAQEEEKKNKKDQKKMHKN